MLYTLWVNPLSAGEDDVVYYYPLRTMVGRCLAEGVWRGSNALEATGAPLMADPQSAVMFPATWLFAVLPGRSAYTLSIFVGFWLAGAGTLVYLRKIGLARAAAAFGAIAFMFSGFLVGHRVHLAMIHTAAFLPWGLWCIEAARTNPRVGFAGMTPVVFLALAAGHWAVLVYVGLVWAAYFLFRGRPFLRSLGVLLAAGALALVIAAPQILATFEALQQTTRQRIGYATAGENSFLPVAAILALLPMIFGSRTPNFFPQQWWGPWHLCEMLGYVGLVTLGLACGAVWRLYRKKGDAPTGVRETGLGDGSAGDGGPRGQRSAGVGDEGTGGREITTPLSDAAHLTGMVRVWTWITIGSGVWMLGYYLPTYRLVHMLPVLGVVRCPARMVLAADLGLATLAAIAVHVLSSRGGKEQRIQRLARTVRGAVTFLLPAAMLLSLGLLGLVAVLLRGIWMPQYPFPMGGAADALEAVTLTNPAVWVPLLLMIVTAAVVWYWLVRPKARVFALIALLLGDLFLLTRFVDVPADYRGAADVGASPAAAWVQERAAREGPFRVYGLSRNYHHRPSELLLPKTCTRMGIATIANYGPLQSSTHVHLFGFRVWGYNRDWPNLLRRNHLLSLYNVRYLIAEAGSPHEKVLQSVRIPAGPLRRDGPELLGVDWALDRAELRGRVLRVRTPFLWRWSIASQDISGRLRPHGVYRIALDARGPRGGAANFLRADVLRKRPDGGWSQPERSGLTVNAERMAADWRHFEWTFETPEDVSGELTFRVFTMSERPIEVRNVSLRESDWPIPVAAERLGAGEGVYCKAAELPALNSGDPNVVIYENRLCDPATAERQSSHEEVESLRWRTSPGADPAGREVPDVSIRAEPPPIWILLGVSLPGTVVCAGIGCARLLGRRSRQKHSAGRQT